MSALNFPVSCAAGHASRLLTSEEELATHHASEHALVPIADYRRSLSNLAGGAADAPPPPPPVSHTSPLAAWGLTKASFTTLTPADLSSGSELSTGLIRDFLTFVGRNQEPSFTIDVSAFLLDFFLYTLYNAATNDPSPTGGFLLREAEGRRTQYIRWSSFFSTATDYFDPLGYAFTPRRMMRTCDPIFWALWSDPDIHGLDRVRTEGTQISRQWRLPNGKHPPAYVVVPQLFTSHLTQDEHDCRKKHQYTITKLSSAADNATYDGLDPENTVIASDTERRAINFRSRDLEHKTAQLQTRGGIGRPDAPRGDSILSQLYPGRV